MIYWIIIRYETLWYAVEWRKTTVVRKNKIIYDRRRNKMFHCKVHSDENNWRKRDEVERKVKYNKSLRFLESRSQMNQVGSFKWNVISSEEKVSEMKRLLRKVRKAVYSLYIVATRHFNKVFELYTLQTKLELLDDFWLTKFIIFIK